MTGGKASCGVCMARSLQTMSSNAIAVLEQKRGRWIGVNLVQNPGGWHLNVNGGREIVISKEVDNCYDSIRSMLLCCFATLLSMILIVPYIS